MITILLADDHAIVREGLRALLESQPDLEVIGDATNGREAVHQAAQLCPEVAILDIAMPELNGIEAVRHIQTICPDTKVIILSMYATTKHILQALQAGARGYLLKESAGSEVVEAVRAVHAGQRHFSQKISGRVIDEFARVRDSKQMEEPLARLTLREREVLQLVVEGKASVEIADSLSLSLSTVNTYRSRLMQKLGIDDLPSLVKFAIQQGLIALE